MALDADRRLIYYTDKLESFIAEITTDGVRKRELFGDRRKHPRAVVVDSDNRCTTSELTVHVHVTFTTLQ